MLSVIIPSYKDPYLHKTIDSLLTNSEGSLEIIVVLDGYTLEKEITKDRRIKVIDFPKNVGMREAINVGVRNARGKYIMKTDEHCKFGKGYDRILIETIKDNWIVTPRRYKLNPETWECFGDPIDYEKLIIGVSMFGKKKGHKKFHGVNWPERSKIFADKMIDEKTGLQGSCWMMSKKWWEKVIVALQTEGYGMLYQDQIEACFKTWRAGGKLMLNKNTWYAHKAKEWPRTHHYSMEKANASFKYGLEQWRDYYEKNVLPKIRNRERQTKRWDREC